MKGIKEYINAEDLDVIMHEKWTLIFGNHSLNLSANCKGQIRVMAGDTPLYHGVDRAMAIQAYANAEAKVINSGVRIVTTL